MDKVRTRCKYLYNKWLNFFTWVRGDRIRHIKFVLFSTALFYTLRVTYVFFYVDNPNWLFINVRFAVALLIVLTVIYVKHYWPANVLRSFIQKHIYDIDLSEDNQRKLKLIRAKASEQFNVDVDKLDEQYYRLTWILYFSSLWTICCGTAASPFLPLAATLQVIIWCIRRHILNQYKYVLRYVEISPEEDVVLPRWRQRLVDLTTLEHIWRVVGEFLQGLADSLNNKPLTHPPEVPPTSSPQKAPQQWRGRFHLTKSVKTGLIIATALASAGGTAVTLDMCFTTPGNRTYREVILTRFADGVYCSSGIPFRQMQELALYGMNVQTLCRPGTSDLDYDATKEAYEEWQASVQEWKDNPARPRPPYSVPMPISRHAEEWQRLAAAEEAKRLPVEDKETDYYV